MPGLPLTIIQAVTIAITAAQAAAIGLCATSYVEGRRKRVTTAFVDGCREVEALGPDMRSNASVREWWARAKTAAGSGWLSEEELAAAKSAAVACGESTEGWAAEKTGRDLPCTAWVVLAAVLTLICGILLTFRGQTQMTWCVTIMFGSLVAISRSDLRYRTIPTEIVLLLACCGIGLQLGISDNPMTSVLYAGVALVATLLTRSLVGNATVGLGDVRLTPVAMLCAGARGAIPCLVATALVAAGYWIWGKVTGKASGKSMMPLGPVLCLGAAVGCVCNLALGV